MIGLEYCQHEWRQALWVLFLLFLAAGCVVLKAKKQIYLETEGFLYKVRVGFSMQKG